MKNLSTLIILLQFLALHAASQSTGLPSFSNAHDVYFVNDFGENTVTRAEPISFPGNDLLGILFVQNNITHISVAHQVEPFEFQIDTLLNVPSLNYYNFRLLKQPDENLQWFFLSRNPQQLTWLPNLFSTDSGSTHPLIGTEGEIVDFEMTDINGNGTPELVSFAGGSNAPLLVWSMTETGYTITDTIGNVAYGTSILTHDLNYDRTPDFVVSGSPLRIFVSTNDSTWVQSTSMPGRAYPTFADIDGDSDLDLVAADYYGSTWSIANNLLQGEFDVQTSTPYFASNQLYAKHVKTLDANGDGKVDILMSTAVNDSLYLWLNNSENNNSFVPVYGVDSPGGAPASLADFDLDGDLDWLAVGPYRRVSILENGQIKLGCTYPDAMNYNPMATTDDASCIFLDPPCLTCPYDGTGDGEVNVADLLGMLSVFGDQCGE